MEKVWCFSGYSENECESQMNIMLARLSSLEDQAYQLAGHPFSLTATDDIAQVTYTIIQFKNDLKKCRL